MQRWSSEIWRHTSINIYLRNWKMWQPGMISLSRTVTLRGMTSRSRHVLVTGHYPWSVPWSCDQTIWVLHHSGGQAGLGANTYLYLNREMLCICIWIGNHKSVFDIWQKTATYFYLKWKIYLYLKWNLKKQCICLWISFSWVVFDFDRKMCTQVSSPPPWCRWVALCVSLVWARSKMA